MSNTSAEFRHELPGEGEIALSKLMEQMEPHLNPGEYVFYTCQNPALPPNIKPIGSFVEKEGTTYILSKTDAVLLGANCANLMAWITLTVHSSLNAVGLTAAVANALSQKNISCNVVAAYFHDHIFVPVSRAKEALNTLIQLSKMKDTNFKKCTLGDLESLQTLCVQTFTDTYKTQNTPENFQAYISKAFNREQLRNELSHPQSLFYFFLLNHQVIGYLKFNELEAQTEKGYDDALEIERIYLLKSAQGQGYGRLMIQKSIEVATSLQKKRIWLGVWEKNSNAIAFYQRMGFTITDTHEFILGDDRQKDFIMEMEVKA